MFKKNSTSKKNSFGNKYASQLWILAGALFILPAVFGDGKNEQIAVGIMFLTLGIVFSKQKEESGDS